MVVDVRRMTSHDVATRPAGALSHAPPVLRLVPRPAPHAVERPPARPSARPWRGVAISALLHAAIIGTILWQMPGGELVTAMSVEVVVWSDPGPTDEAASGEAVAAASEPPAESAQTAALPEPVAEPPAETALPKPAEPTQPVAADAAPVPPQPVEAAMVAMPEPPALPVAELPQPAPEVATEVLAETRPPEAVVAREAIQLAVVPPPPPPRPAPPRATEPEQKAQTQPPLAEQSAERSQQQAPAPDARSAPKADTSEDLQTAAAAAAPQPPGEIPLIHEPRYRVPPTPARYPPRALDLNQQGTVVVRALVSPDGTSDEIVVWRSSGYSLLDAAAVRAVRGWAFEPASIAGRRIASWVEVPVRFAIR
jgi:protein TonB